MTDPYKELFYAVQEADRLLRAGRPPITPEFVAEFLDAWREIADRLATAEAYDVVQDLQECGVWREE